MSTQADQKPKKFTSKLFRVATEGATTDGRQIERAWIAQMAASYNPATYGARVWIEHIRGIAPDSTFRAYGDVIALEAREVEDKKLALFARIDPTPELIELTKSRQKIYTSLEINPRFADTGQAYLVGLAVTDSPASLGTDVLAFAQKNPQASPFAARKQDADNLFSEGVEVVLEFDEEESGGSGLLDRVRAVLKKFSASERAASADARTEIGQAIEEVAADVSELHKYRAALDGDIKSISEQIKTLESNIQQLGQRIDTTPGKYTQHPPATGGDGRILTDV